MGSGLTAAEEAKKREEAHARAEANRLRIEAENQRKLAERAKQAKEKAEKAEQDRIEKEAKRQADSAAMLAALKVRWHQATTHVEALKDTKFSECRQRVANWKERRTSCLQKGQAMDDDHDKKMKDQFQEGERRYKKWRAENEEMLRQKAAAVAAKRKEAGALFEKNVDAYNERMEEVRQRGARRSCTACMHAHARLSRAWHVHGMDARRRRSRRR